MLSIWVYTPISIVYHNLFIHSYVDTHLGCSQFGLLQIDYYEHLHTSHFEHMFSFLTDAYLEVEYGSYCRLMLQFSETVKMLSKLVITMVHFHKQSMRFPVLHILTNTWYGQF